MINSHRGPSIDASYQVSVYLAKLCQSRRFLEIDQSGKKIVWWPCLLTDWEKISNLYKRNFHRCFLPSFGSFGHAVSEEIFRNRPIRNKNRLWWPCLLMDRDRMSNLYSRPNNLSLVCLYLSLYISFLLFGHFFFKRRDRKHYYIKVVESMQFVCAGNSGISQALCNANV